MELEKDAGQDSGKSAASGWKERSRKEDERGSDAFFI
jgi:hypothetical protein